MESALNTAKSFTPSVRKTAVRTAIGCAVAGVIIFLVARLSPRYSETASSTSQALLVCFVAAIVTGVWLFFFFKAVTRLPRKVELSGTGILFVQRKGGDLALPWDSLQQVEMSSKGGWHWRIDSTAGTIALPEDGFSKLEWNEICDAVLTNCESRNISIVLNETAKMRLKLRERIKELEIRKQNALRRLRTPSQGDKQSTRPNE